MALLEKALTRASDPDAVEHRIKEQIEEIVRAYRHSWDVYSELLQNSVDAINRRFRILNDPDFYLYSSYRSNMDLQPDEAYRGRIHIIVDIPNRTIQIYDNGVGISKEKIEEFLLPAGGDKKIAQEYGFKGYGLTFVAFISEEFRLESVPFHIENPTKAGIELHGLFQWLSDQNDHTSFPDTPTPDVIPLEVEGEWWNTYIKIKLAKDYSAKFPAISSAENAISLAEAGWKKTDLQFKPEGFEFILRTKTAIGNTRPLFNNAPLVPIDITLDITNSEGISSTKIPISYSYYHPRLHREISIDSYDFQDYYDNRYTRAGVEKDFRSLYHAITNVPIGVRRPLSCNIALSAIATRRLTHIADDLGLTNYSSGDTDIMYGIHLAIDGMPTGLKIDDWDRRGNYLQRYYVVVDADMNISNQLDPGRKGISDYYARLISEKVLDLLSTSTVNGSDPFNRYASSHLNHGRARGSDDDLPSLDFQNKVLQSRDWERAAENDSELYRKLQELSHLLAFPEHDEQEVIALFYELQSLNVIKGYKTVYISGNAVYDAAFDYKISCTPDNVYPRDPLGIGQVIVDGLQRRGLDSWDHSRLHHQLSTYPELCVDFKRNLGAFLDEINRPRSSSKNPNTLDLLIFWDLQVPSSIPSELYTIDPITDNRRRYHSTTHRLGLAGHYSTEIACISLKHVLQQIISPD